MAAAAGIVETIDTAPALNTWHRSMEPGSCITILDSDSQFHIVNEAAATLDDGRTGFGRMSIHSLALMCRGSPTWVIDQPTARREDARKATRWSGSGEPLI